MTHDLIINGTTLVEGVDTAQSYSSVPELLAAEYLPLLNALNPGVTGLGSGDGGVLVAWSRVTTLEVRLRG